MATSKRKKLKIVFNAPVILGFVFACFIVQLFNTISSGRTGEILFMTYHSSLKNPLTYIRFFTHVLGHNGWEHLISNMVYVLLLGPLLEEKYAEDKEYVMKVKSIAGEVKLCQEILEYQKK